jgi:hypothetical protein
MGVFDTDVRISFNVEREATKGPDSHVVSKRTKERTSYNIG